MSFRTDWICPICGQPVGYTNGCRVWRVSDLPHDHPEYQQPYVESITHWGYCTDRAKEATAHEAYEAYGDDAAPA
jgi:PHP family Zn ribbon phosphoesterase